MIAALAGPLAAGLEAMGIAADATARERMLDYLALLQRWNKVYNLTAIRDPAEWVPKQLLDSASLQPLLPPGSLLDIGTGPGLPGLVIAMLEPQREILLVDSNAKKTRFLTQAVATLGLENVKVRHCRVEALAPSTRFAAITSRAFAALADFARLALPLCRQEEGMMLAMKGRYPAEELQDLPPGVRLLRVDRVEIPGLGAERHIVSLIPTREC